MTKSIAIIALFSLLWVGGLEGSAQPGQSDFELYGDEKPDNGKKKKTKKKDSADPYSNVYDALEANSPEAATQKKETITLELPHLFEGTIDTVVLSAKKSDLSFRDRENIKYYYSEALQKLQNKDYEGMIEYLSKSIRKDPNRKELLQLRANAYIETGKFRKGIKDLKKVLKVAPEDPTVHYNMATVYSKSSKYKKAIKHFDKAIYKNPDYLLAFQGRATALTMVHKYGAAIEDYNRVVQLNNFFTAAYKGRGIAKTMTGNFEDASTDLTKALELSPKDGYIYYYRGIAFLQMKQFSNACNDFEEAYTRRVREAAYQLEKVCNSYSVEE